MMHITKRYQRGMSTGGLVMLLVVGGFIMWIFFKLMTPYQNYLKVAGMMENLKSQPEMRSKPDNEIYKSMLTRLSVDSVNVLNDQNIRQQAKIERDSKGVRLTVKYKEEIPLFPQQGLYFLISFDKTVEL